MSVAVPKPKIKYTYEDYKSLSVCENKQYELLDGEIIMVPAPSTYHQKISGQIYFLIKLFVEKTSSKDRLDIIKEEEIRGAPDLVIEILSPATEKKDRFYKKSLYARHAVREYWIVDPDKKTIELYTLTEEGLKLHQEYKIGDILRSIVLEGLEIDLKDIF